MRNMKINKLLQFIAYILTALIAVGMIVMLFE